MTSLYRLTKDGPAGAEARATLAEVYGAFREGHATRDLAAARDLLAG